MVDINYHKTRAEELMQKRGNLPPEISDHMARSVSEQRREMLEFQLDHGEFREKGATAAGLSPVKYGDMDLNRATQAGVVSGSSVAATLRKIAQATYYSPQGNARLGAAL